VDDDATIVLAYPRQAVIQASWNWPFSRKDMEVYGANGYAITVESDKLRVRHEHEALEQLTTSPSSLRGKQFSELPVRGAARRDRSEGRSQLSTPNVVVMQILDAARESARTGKSVQAQKAR